jgi:hypothetical protein
VGAAYRRPGPGTGWWSWSGPRPGGAAASFELDGIRVDHGSHRLHPAIEPRILDDLRGLLGDELQRRPRNGRIYLEGRWIRFPLRPADLARRLPPSFAAGAAADAATAWARRPRADTFAETLRAGLGPTMCERFYFPYARKLWGLDPSELAGEQARRRVSAGSPARLLARVARGAGATGPWFWYPRRGFGSIPSAWPTRPPTPGPSSAMVTSRRAGRAAPRGSHRHPGRRGAAEARRVWSTVPCPPWPGWPTRPRPPTCSRGRAARLPAMVLVYLVLEAAATAL